MTVLGDAAYNVSERWDDLTLQEADGAAGTFNDDGTVNVVILRPCNGRGVGSRIYLPEVLARDAGVFAGAAMFDNHESPEAARARKGIPRAPSDLAGQVLQSWWDPGFTTPRDAEMGFERGAVLGRVSVTEAMEGLIRRLPGAVKLSVNATATGFRPGTRNGKRGLVVEGIANDPENTSVDFVTKAGAGGEVQQALIEALIEREDGGMSDKMQDERADRALREANETAAWLRERGMDPRHHGFPTESGYEVEGEPSGGAAVASRLVEATTSRGGGRALPPGHGSFAEMCRTRGLDRAMWRKGGGL